MPHRMLVLLATLITAVVLASPAAAQEPTSSTSAVEVPTQDIVPEPNTGEAPTEAGDRGGALQLGLLALLVLVIGGNVVNLVRRSRQARSD